MALYGRARNTRLLVISLVMLSLATITVDYRGGDSGPFEVAGRSSLTVVGALQGAVNKVLHPIGAFLGGIAHLGTLQSENERLKSQIAALRAQNGQSVSLKRQLEQAQSLLKLRQQLG